jgi:protein-disulfide isomerase
MLRTITALMFAAVAFAALPAVAASATDAPADPRMVEHSRGKATAPVRIDEYYSLDCPHCAAFTQETLPQLQKTYIDTGKVFLVLHDFPLHEMALRATMLARCAPPDRFFPMIETLFAVQRGWLLQTEEASMAALKQQAKFAGLTDAQIEACLNDRGLEDAILTKRLEAEKELMITATPTFIFNQDSNNRIAAAATFDTFKQKIDGLLSK